MGGLWGKFWWRAVFVCGLMLSIYGLVALAMAGVPVLLVQPRGTLDFAGGAVVHVNPLPVLVFLTVPWLAVEVYNLRRPTPVPFGSYAAFGTAFVVVMAVTAYGPQMPRGEWGWSGLVFPLLVFALAGAAGVAAGWTYARLTRKRPKPEENF